VFFEGILKKRKRWVFMGKREKK